MAQFLFSSAADGDAGGITAGPEAPGMPRPVRNQARNFALAVAREDVIGAAHYLSEIVLRLKHRIVFASPGPGVVDFSVSPQPADLRALSLELSGVDFKLVQGAAWHALTAATTACAQMLFRSGEQDTAATFLNALLRRPGGDNHVLRDIRLAQDRLREEGDKAPILIRNLAVGGLDYLKYFQGKYCGHPFNDFEVGSDGSVYVCCPSHLPKTIGNAFAVGSPDELKSSKALAKIKDSILKQDFRYCRWAHCPSIKDDMLPARPPEPKADYVPTDFRLSYDPTCNLSCPSCRTEKIVAKGAQRERIMRFTDDTVLPMLKLAETCMMNGYGDVFASKACRNILETVNPIEYPRLKFDFITNGVLFTRAEWEKFPGIHKMVRSIKVSIDAARKQTYDKLRVGGDWDVLLDNLKFMSELRRDRIIRQLDIVMVVQDTNFEEMAEFAQLAKDFGCDRAVFQALMNWNTFAPMVFESKAVHYSSHPRHAEFMLELERLRKVLPVGVLQEQGGLPPAPSTFTTIQI